MITVTKHTILNIQRRKKDVNDKCKRVKELNEIPIIKALELLMNDDYVCSECGKLITTEDYINMTKE